MIRLPNITWLVALSGLAWLAMPADAAIGSIASDWNANEAALESVVQLATDGAGSSASTDSKFRWQPEEEPTSIDELSATLPADGGMSSNGVSQTSSTGANSSIVLGSGQIVPDPQPAHRLAAEISEQVPDPPTGGIFHPPKS